MPGKSELIQIPVASTVESALLMHGARSLLLCIVPSCSKLPAWIQCISLLLGEKALCFLSKPKPSLKHDLSCDRDEKFLECWNP